MYMPVVAPNFVRSSSTGTSAPHAEFRDADKFRIVGQEATTHTRMINDNSVWKQERSVQNMYEYQRNTQMTFNGDVTRNGTRGSFGRSA